MKAADPNILREIFLARQPILDRDQAIVAYELRFPRGGRPVDAERTVAAVVCAAFGELGIAHALGSARAFIEVDSAFLHDDAVESLPPAGVVLELKSIDPPDEATLARCRALKERGYALSLASYRGPDDRALALLPLLDLVRIDVRAYGDAALSELAGALLPLPVRLLAEGVETREQRERCHAIGFHLFQGYYFARPVVVSGRQLSATQLGLIRLINVIARDAETAEIEDAFKHEPGLTINLLRLVNSVGAELPTRVTSLRHAVTLLGRRQILRWLQLLLMAAPEGDADVSRNPLLQLAALRGRLMEVLAGKRRRGDRRQGDLAFLAGIMSLMPAALGLPMDEILAQLAVAPEVRDALQGKETELGQLLALSERCDENDAEGCDALLAKIGHGFDRLTLNTGLAEALRWIHAAP